MNTNSLTAEREHLANLQDTFGAHSLTVEPATNDFEAEFRQVCSAVGT